MLENAWGAENAEMRFVLSQLVKFSTVEVSLQLWLDSIHTVHTVTISAFHTRETANDKWWSPVFVADGGTVRDLWGIYGCSMFEMYPGWLRRYPVQNVAILNV